MRSGFDPDIRTESWVAASTATLRLQTWAWGVCFEPSDLPTVIHEALMQHSEAISST